MNPRTKARILAAVLVAVLLSLTGYLIENNNSAMGKEAFLASQAVRFDQYYAKLHPISHFVAVGTLFGGVLLGVYELLALGIYSAIKPRKPEREE
jgi:hypothetical protein